MIPWYHNTIVKSKSYMHRLMLSFGQAKHDVIIWEAKLQPAGTTTAPSPPHNPSHFFSNHSHALRATAKHIEMFVFKGVEVAASHQSLKVCHVLTWLLVPALRSACKMYQNAICPHPSQICSSGSWSHLNDPEANFSHRFLHLNRHVI